ncbi:MAG TPA: hypothetical protein VHA52_07655 [Candidatus Babeliaceae bacterium]|nr:hypothetical protein [Candidatus Babeliaceae bacterium]
MILHLLRTIGTLVKSKSALYADDLKKLWEYEGKTLRERRAVNQNAEASVIIKSAGNHQPQIEKPRISSRDQYLPFAILA